MKRLIFTLTGVSLLDEKKGLLGTRSVHDSNLSTIRGHPNIDTIIENDASLRQCKEQAFIALKIRSLRDNLDMFSAEIAGLYRLDSLDNKDDKVILIVSQTPECAFSGIVNGKFIIYRRTKNHNWDSIVFNRSTDVFRCDNVEIKIIDGLQVTKGTTFIAKGIKHLFSFVSNTIKDEGDSYDEVIFNITGGYKGTIPYLTLFGMLYQGREIRGKKVNPSIQYLYEESENIITLPNLPIAFDLLTWRDYRGLIRTMELLERNQADIIKKVLPPHVSGLFEFQTSKYRLNPFGEELRDRYQQEKLSLTSFGRGYLLLDKIADESLRAYLKGCINQWQHIWISDKIPEMVEHQRGHTQRVLELAAEMLYPILAGENQEIFKNDVELASVIGAIWLHDLGNSGERFEVNDEEYIIRGFPSLIRDFHNLITDTILAEEHQRIFPSEIGVGDGRIQRSEVKNLGGIIDNIRTISKYHRKWTPLIPDKVAEKGKHGIKLTQPVTDDNLRFLTALYRVLDACDTQFERTVDDAYISTRKMTVDWEVRILIKGKEELESSAEISNFIAHLHKESSDTDLTSLTGDLKWIFGEDKAAQKKIDKYADSINRIVGNTKTCSNSKVSDNVERWLSYLDQIFFKKRQPLHYGKHRGIDAVMILPEPKDNEDEGYKFNIRMVGAESTTEQQLKNVLHQDIIKEYLEVKEVLNHFVKFKFSYQCYHQAPQTYKDYSDFETTPCALESVE